MAIDLRIAGRGSVASTTEAVNQRDANAGPVANYDEIKAYLGTGRQTAVLRVKYGSTENNLHLGTERFGVRTFKGDRDALTVSVLKASVENRFGGAAYGQELERLLTRPNGQGYSLTKTAVANALAALEAMHANAGVMPDNGNRAAPVLDPHQVYTDQLLRAAGEGQKKYGDVNLGGQSLLSVIENQTARIEEQVNDLGNYDFMLENASLVNQIFRNNDRLVRAGTDNPELTARINDLREKYLNNPQIKPMTDYLESITMSAKDGDMFVFLTRKNTLMCIDSDNLDKILRLDVEDIAIGVVEYRTVGDSVEKLDEGDVDHAALYREFPFMTEALIAVTARQQDPATRTADLIFGVDPDFAMVVKSAMHGNYRPLTWDVMSTRILPRVAALITNLNKMDQPDNWDEMEVRPEHLADLRQAMTASGIEDSDTNFAKYLFNLSAVYMNLSGTSRLGSEGLSILPLRAYSFLLMKAAEEADSTLFRRGDLDGADGHMTIAKANRCADILSKNMLALCRAIDPAIYTQIVHEDLRQSADHIDVVRAPNNPAIDQVQDAGDIGIAGLRRSTVIDIDDLRSSTTSEDESRDSGVMEGLFANFLRQQLNLYAEQD